MRASRNKIYRFSLHISQQQYLRYYQGTACNVQVYAENGQLLRFPASRLRPFLTHTGISGRFQLLISPENRLIDLKKIS